MILFANGERWVSRDSRKDPYYYAKSRHQNYEIDIVSFDYGFSFCRWNVFKDGLCSIIVL
jgi:hypothetical protein